MHIKQISVSLSNEPGQFLAVSENLGAEGINIRAISVADTADVSTVRFVTDDPDRTLMVLKSHNYTVKETNVFAVEVPDHPGGLRAASGNAIVIIGVDKNTEADNVFRKNWVKTFGDEIYSL